MSGREALDAGAELGRLPDEHRAHVDVDHVLAEHGGFVHPGQLGESGRGERRCRRCCRRGSQWRWRGLSCDACADEYGLGRLVRAVDEALRVEVDTSDAVLIFPVGREEGRVAGGAVGLEPEALDNATLCAAVRVASAVDDFVEVKVHI